MKDGVRYSPPGRIDITVGQEQVDAVIRVASPSEARSHFTIWLPRTIHSLDGGSFD
jgi:hypothetical protein